MPYTTNKHQHKSKPCVFLGYSLNHQGYKCLDLFTRRIYVSRHVLFNEDNFPFKDLTSSKGSGFKSGALQYLTITRLDFAYPVNQVCQFMQNPTSTHCSMLYLMQTMLVIQILDIPLVVFVFIWEKTWFHGSSKKQKTVSRSITEAKYRQLAHTAPELSWFRSLLCDLQLCLSPPQIWFDNMSSLAMASNPDQIANLFTKGLCVVRFKYLVSKLLVVQKPVSLQGDVR
ncbi:hypothetical protein L3X38_002985 [Prunus dulcis]|uniref:Retroviral polymerase SH3-like domain-containing protein n=1 Tax=Prunus dulcis TaxID=3755 RepID=A0AAD4ZL85_PRUDU|nr:hypothetical protein L3X38_002985 [Prunus dulcis]